MKPWEWATALQLRCTTDACVTFTCLVVEPPHFGTFALCVGENSRIYHGDEERDRGKALFKRVCGMRLRALESKP